MVQQGPNFGVDRGFSDEAEPEGFNLERLIELGGFMLRATRRRIKLALLSFVIVAAAGVTLAATMPKAYVARVKLLAQRGSAFRELSSPHPSMEAAYNPTKTVAALILGHDNLVALAKDSNLVERFEATRSPALRLKDRLLGRLFSQPSAEDKLLGMVYTLEKQVDVTLDEANVTITVEWPNAQIAYDLVTLVQKNFLEARYDSDVAEINDSLSVLEDHAKTELAHVDAKLDEYQRIEDDRAARRRAAEKPAAPQVFVMPSPRSGVGAQSSLPTDPEPAKALEQVRRHIRSLEDDRQREVDSVRQQLMQAQLTLTPMHPTVIALQQQLEVLNQPSPELTQLRADERSVMAQIAPPLATLPRVSAPSGPAAPPSGTNGLSALLAASALSDAGESASKPLRGSDKDAKLELAESELSSAIRAYEEVLSRIDSAKVELDITRAGYKHRYTVIAPAEVPRTPKKATARALGAASIVAAALFAILLATGLDMLPGKVIEPWQVRRRLKLDVIGELDNPS
jgi:uncharacterized protein involved in exopolysaccharide biosynthesis